MRPQCGLYLAAGRTPAFRPGTRPGANAGRGWCSRRRAARPSRCASTSGRTAGRARRQGARPGAERGPAARYRPAGAAGPGLPPGEVTGHGAAAGREHGPGPAGPAAGIGSPGRLEPGGLLAPGRSVRAGPGGGRGTQLAGRGQRGAVRAEPRGQPGPDPRGGRAYRGGVAVLAAAGLMVQGVEDVGGPPACEPERPGQVPQMLGGQAPQQADTLLHGPGRRQRLAAALRDSAERRRARARQQGLSARSAGLLGLVFGFGLARVRGFIRLPTGAR